MVEFSRWPDFWKIIVKTMTGSIVTAEVAAHFYVILGKQQKHMPYGELVDTIVCITL